MTDAPTRPSPRRRQAALSVLSGLCALLLVVGIVRAPGEAFRASLAGLQLWWQTVFPGLLPPLILAELLAASGLLHALGAIGEPLTRRLFRLPGAAGWPIALGWTAGMPIGAREAGRLKEKGLLRDADLDTLLLVAHMPNPFLIVLVVGSGFLASPAYGWALVLGLWASAVAAGFLWSRLAKPASPPVPASLAFGRPATLLRRLARVVREAREEDGRPFGKQIADAVSHAVTTLLAVGGLVMMSSVLIRMLQIAWPGMDAWLAIPGVYELHLGAYEAGRSALFDAAPAQAVALLAAVLAWSGWSGLLQARAVAGVGAAFPWGRFLAGRLLHAALALLVTYPLATAVQRGWLSGLAPAWAPAGAAPSDQVAWEVAIPGGWRYMSEMTITAIVSIAVFLLLALLAALIRPGRRPPGDR